MKEKIASKRSDAVSAEINEKHGRSMAKQELDDRIIHRKVKQLFYSCEIFPQLFFRFWKNKLEKYNFYAMFWTYFFGFQKIILVFRTKSLNASQFISQFSTTTAFIWDCICFFLWYFSNLRLLSWTTSFRSSCQLESLLASPTLNKLKKNRFEQ